MWGVIFAVGALPFDVVGLAVVLFVATLASLSSPLLLLFFGQPSECDLPPCKVAIVEVSKGEMGIAGVRADIVHCVFDRADPVLAAAAGVLYSSEQFLA